MVLSCSQLVSQLPDELIEIRKSDRRNHRAFLPNCFPRSLKFLLILVVGGCSRLVQILLTGDRAQLTDSVDTAQPSAQCVLYYSIDSLILSDRQINKQDATLINTPHPQSTLHTLRSQRNWKKIYTMAVVTHINKLRRMNVCICLLYTSPSPRDS